jgi:hypothetical protein
MRRKLNNEKKSRNAGKFAAFPLLTQVGEIDFPFSKKAHILNRRSGASAMISLTHSTRASLRWHHKIFASSTSAGTLARWTGAARTARLLSAEAQIGMHGRDF